MEPFVHCLSPPNTYSYVQEENLGSTRKLVKNYFLFIINLFTIQILTLHLLSVDGLVESF